MSFYNTFRWFVQPTFPCLSCASSSHAISRSTKATARNLPRSSSSNFFEAQEFVYLKIGSMFEVSISIYIYEMLRTVWASQELVEKACSSQIMVRADCRPARWSFAPQKSSNAWRCHCKTLKCVINLFHCQYDFTCEFRPMHFAILYIHIYYIHIIYIYIYVSWCILHHWCRPVPIKVGVNGALPGSDSVPSGLRDLTSGQTVHDCAMQAGSSLRLYLWCKEVFWCILMYFVCIFTQVAGPKATNSPLWCIPFKSIPLRYGRDMMVKRCWGV